MPYKKVDPVLSKAAKLSAAKSPWRYGYGGDRFGSTVEPRLICSPCYDLIRSYTPGLSRIVQYPGKKLRCVKCGKVYSNGREGRSKRAAA